MSKHKHNHIKIYFDDEDILHVHAKDSIGAMALKHYITKLQLYGAKMLNVNPEIIEKTGKELAVIA